MPDNLETWREAWSSGETPWVYPEADKALHKFLGDVVARCTPAPKRWLVPLCGTSPSVRYLFDLGYFVVGVDGIDAPLETLVTTHFPEHSFVKESGNGTTLRRAAGVELVTSDIFDLELEQPVDAIYDRAALVAVIPPERSRYAAVLDRGLRPGGVICIEAIELKGAERTDPPFPITTAEVAALFPGYALTELGRVPVDPLPPHLEAAGATALEKTFSVLVKPATGLVKPATRPVKSATGPVKPATGSYAR